VLAICRTPFAATKAGPPDEPRDESGKWTDGGGSGEGQGNGSGESGAGSGGGGAAGARSPDEASSSAAKAASGYPKLEGLPSKPLKVGGGYLVPGPFGKAKAAAEKYMQAAGLPYNPPKQYLKVDKDRATRIADAFDKMKHDPDDPAVKASYEALAKETLAQWQAIKATGLKVEWIKPGQDNPYTATPRMAALDVINNNHWWGFPTDAGFGSGTAEAEAATHNNPMLKMTDEVVDGRKLMVNDVFRIVHDYFGHFKEGVGFRADGEENAWRSHAAMYSDLARGAMTSETRGQNSWVNYGPYGETNRTASEVDTHFAPQKIGLMPEWTWNDGRGDPKKKIDLYRMRARSRADLVVHGIKLRAGFDPSQPRDPGGKWEGDGSGGEGAADKPEAKPAADKPLGGNEGGGKKKAEIADFAKDNISVDDATRTDPEKQKKFIDTWNGKIGEAPAEFQKSFLGGLKSTMHIEYKEPNSLFIYGRLLDADGDKIGEYQRTIDFAREEATSEYFKLNEDQEKKGIGKQMLAANMREYQKLGIAEVNVHANIDIGGYAWARYGYVPNDREWRNLASDIENKIDNLSGGGGFAATSWDELNSTQQDRIEKAWMRSTRDEMYDYEVESWRDGGQALHDAKIGMVIGLTKAENDDWATEAVSAYREAREEKGQSPIPFTDEQILEALDLDFNDRYGDGRGDPDIGFKDDKLTEPEGFDPAQMELPGIDATKPHELLTDAMREGLTKAISKAFDREAERRESDIEPPGYLAENLDETQGEYWDSMDDASKYKWATQNAEDYLGQTSEGTGEMDEADAERLRKLTQSDDPKALWAIADSDWGKELLLGTDWNGFIDLRDKEHMARFNAYVGKAKKAA
jgi:hypothetical protein